MANWNTENKLALREVGCEGRRRVELVEDLFRQRHLILEGLNPSFEQGSSVIQGKAKRHDYLNSIPDEDKAFLLSKMSELCPRPSQSGYSWQGAGGSGACIQYRYINYVEPWLANLLYTVTIQQVLGNLNLARSVSHSIGTPLLSPQTGVTCQAASSSGATRLVLRSLAGSHVCSK